MQISENHMMSPFCACVLQQSAATLAGNRGLSEPASVGEESQVGWRSRVWRCPLSLLQAGR